MTRKYGRRRAKTCLRAYADSDAQSDQGIRCPLTESLDTIKFIKCLDETLRMRGINLNLCILRTFEDTFSLEVAHINYTKVKYIRDVSHTTSPAVAVK